MIGRLSSGWTALRYLCTTRAREDRGDVPGWVMITIMTAALVVAILIPFQDAIVDAVDNALNSVIDESAP